MLLHVTGSPGRHPGVRKRLEGLGMKAADAAVDAVGGDDQVGVPVGLEILDLGLELQLDAEAARPGLQDVEQALARDAAKAMAARGDHLAPEVDVDVVPVGKAVEDLGRALRVVGAQVVHGLVGEDDAPAEGVVGPVALDDDDLVGAGAQLHGDREVEPGGPASDANDLHRAISRILCGLEPVLRTRIAAAWTSRQAVRGAGISLALDPQVAVFGQGRDAGFRLTSEYRRALPGRRLGVDALASGSIRLFLVKKSLIQHARAERAAASIISRKEVKDMYDLSISLEPGEERNKNTVTE